MGFTYNAAQLTQPLNRLRFLVQDTDAEGFLFDDAEITFLFSQQSNIHRAAAQLCRVKAAKYASMPNVDDESLKFDSQARAREMRLLADEYEREALRSLSIPEGDSEEGSDFSLFADSDSLIADGGAAGGPSAFTRGLHFSR